MVNLTWKRLGTVASVALLTLAALLLAPAAEASRSSLPAALAPALTSPAMPTDIFQDEAPKPQPRLRLFADLSLPERPLGLVEAQKTASGAFTLGIQSNIWQTGGLGQNRSGPSFQGLWTDPVTGIAYARNRWYDARTASWLSEDPMGSVDSPNLYAFVGWQPHAATDPMGLTKIALWYGRGSEYGMGEGFDDLANQIAKNAQEMGLPYRIVEVTSGGKKNIIWESEGYQDTVDDYEVYLLSSVSNDVIPVLDAIEKDFAESSEETILVGHSLGAVRQHRFAEKLDKAGKTVDLFVSIDMHNFFWPSPRSMPENVEQLLVFYSDPTREQKEKSGIMEPEGVRSFKTDSQTTNVIAEIGIEDVHTNMDNNPDVQQRVLEEILKLRSGQLTYEELAKVYGQYTQPSRTSEEPPRR